MLSDQPDVYAQGGTNDPAGAGSYSSAKGRTISTRTRRYSFMDQQGSSIGIGAAGFPQLKQLSGARQGRAGGPYARSATWQCQCCPRAIQAEPNHKFDTAPSSRAAFGMARLPACWRRRPGAGQMLCNKRPVVRISRRWVIPEWKKGRPRAQHKRPGGQPAYPLLNRKVAGHTQRRGAIGGDRISFILVAVPVRSTNENSSPCSVVAALAGWWNDELRK
jgi:hypothetical protein